MTSDKAGDRDGGWLRRLGAGRAAMRFIFRPTAYPRWILSFGLAGACRYVLGEAAMRRSARRLPVMTAGSEALAATYLTGRLHWHQTAFGAWSLARTLPAGLRPTFYDDGSLRRQQVGWLRAIFPHSRIVPRPEALALLEKRLPVRRFPRLRQAEQASMFFRKLVTIRTEPAPWRLYLDSDMLFFRRPVEVEEAARRRQALYLLDHTFAYCLPVEQVEALAGRPVPPRVNGGLVALNDDRIDWEQVEDWLARMPAAARSHAMLEQTVTAMIISGQEPAVAAPPAYRIVYHSGPPPTEATLIHYLYRSKVLFLSREWKRVLALPSAA